MAKAGLKNPPKPPKEEVKPEAQAFVEKIEQTAETMLKGCSKIRCRYSWFGTAAKIDDDTLQEMIGAGTPEEVRKALAVYKRLLKSNHPAMVAAKQSFQAIKDYVNSMSIPMIALQKADDPDASLRKDGGVRLVQKKDMEDFDERMQYLTSVLKTAAEGLQLAMPQIQEEDRERLDKISKKLYNPKDYPSDVTKLVGVTYSFETVGIDPDWAELCPKIYERESFNARQKFELVVENAAVEFAAQFVSYVKQVVDQLGNRMRLNPKAGHEVITVRLDDDKTGQVTCNEAEIVTRLGNGDNPDDIPPGHVMLELRLKSTRGKGQSTVVWLAEPITEKHFFENLRPYEAAAEKKKLYDSTVANLKAKLETFLNVGSMLGPYEKVISQSVTKVKEMLTQASSNLDVGQITAQLRSGDYFRNQMKGALEGVAHAVQAAMGDAKEKRRSIKKSLMGEV